MKLKVDGFLMYGDYTEEQIDKIYCELKKPKNKQGYIMGIDLSRVNNIEVMKGGLN